MRCPVCRAENQGEPTCRRCRADLAPLLALEARRAAALAESSRALVAGDTSAAALHADEAQRLRAGPEALRARAVAALLGRDFSQALACYLALLDESD